MMASNYYHRPDKPVFMDEAEIEQILNAMEEDMLLNTSPMQVKDTEDSVREVTFREKHLTYLKKHPKVNPENYLSNVKAMIRIRNS